MAYDDITKTGAQSFRDLQLANDADFESAVAAKRKKLSDTYNSYAKSKAFDPYENAPQKVRSSLYGTPTRWGESMFDETDHAVNANEFEHIQDTRANNQPWYAQLAAGIGKGVGLAGTTFIDGIAGLLVGGIEAVAQGDISRLWDNEVSNGLHDFNQAMEEWMPNYRTEDEQNRPWYENLGTVNFWADSFLKNMGFTVGALYSGGVWTKGLKYAGKAIQTLGKLGEASKLAKGAESLGVAMQTNGLGAKLTGSLFSAVNEGRIEANNNTHDLRDLQVQQASDAAAKRREEILEDTSLSEEERISQLEELDANYNTTLEQIDDNLKKAGLTDFLLNIPILAIDNFWTFGRMYAQGFQNAKNTVTKNVKKEAEEGFLSRASTAANEAADAAENTIARNTKKEGSRYLWDTITKKKSIGKGLLTGLREGNEEMAQAWAAEYAGNSNFYKDGTDTYYRAMTNPKALQETMSSWEAASKAFTDTYGNLDRYEEFAVGALTGLLGTPTFGRMQNSSANTYLGRGKMVGLSGGIFGEIASDSESNRIGREHVARMNAMLDKRDQIDRTARVHSAMNQFNDAMNGFAESDDKFEFNNESDNADWMGITSFISTGREEDLKTLLGQDFENLTDQELEAIARSTAQSDDDTVGGFREKGSGKLITADSPQSDKDEMRKKLAERRDEMLEKIDAYKNSVDIIRNYAAGNPNVTEEEVNELAWMHWKVNRFDSRADEIKKRNAEKFILLSQALEEYNRKQQEILDEQEESTEGLSAAAMSVAEHKNAELAEKKKIAKRNLEYTRELLGIINSVASSNKNVMKYLAPMLSIDKGFLDGILNSENFYDTAISQGLSKPEFDKVIRDIRDLGRLAEANKTFNKKLKEYMEDPFKQKKDHAKIDQENEAVTDEINKETKRKKAKQATRQQMLSGEVDPDEVINNTNTDDVERIAAKDAKVTAKVQQRVESIIASQNQEGTISDEDVARIEATIRKAVSNSKSVNDLTGTNAAFMVDADGQPLTDEQIALIQDIMNKAVKDVAEAEGLNITDSNIDFNKVEEAVESQTGPSDKAAQAAEKTIERTDTTGNDAVEKIAASNDGIPSGRRTTRKRKGTQQTSKKNNLQQRKKANTVEKKATREKEAKEAAERRKREVVSAALTFAINGNAINISTDEGKQEVQLLSNLLSKAYDLINEGKIGKLSGINDVLKSMDEYEKLQNLLGRTPALASALTSLSNSLNRTFVAEETSQETNTELEEKIGPETTEGEKPDPTDFSSQKLNPAINIPNYFAPATSQFYRDPKTGQISPVPFTAKVTIKDKKRKKKLTETYNYLQKLGAFKSASKVEVGDDIYFTVHPALNSAAGGVVILMSTDPKGENVVGDLADIDSYTYENNPLLKAMVDRITEEFNNREDKDSSEPFVSKETSSVRQTMVGHVMFTDSKSSNTDNTLNEVFGEGAFKMGVVSRAGKVITTNQGDESISNDIDVVTPKTKFTPGTPVVLIPSGKGTNKYIAVPFQMSKYDSSMRSTKFSQYVEAMLQRALLNQNGEPLDLSTTKAQMLVKSALNALFNGDFHVNFNNGQLVIHQTIKTVKDGVVSKKNEYIYRGTPDSKIVSTLIKALQDRGMTIRIDRREINKTGNLKDLQFSYNTMMGDLAHTNLSDKSSTTVNDWFIVNPVNEQGKEIRIDRVEYRDTRQKEGPIQRNDTKVTYNGKDYFVSEEDKIVDKDGKPITGIDVTQQQIILAKAEVERNDVMLPIGTEGEQIYWYKLPNNNLFYNKEGEEKILVNEQELQEQIANLTKEEEPASVETETHVYRQQVDAEGHITSIPVEPSPRALKDLKPDDTFLSPSGDYIYKVLNNNHEKGYLIVQEINSKKSLKIDYSQNTQDTLAWVENEDTKVDVLLKENASDSQLENTESQGTQEKQDSYPKGFTTQQLKDFFDNMPKERQKILLDANSNAISAIIPAIKEIMDNFGIDDLDDAEDDIDNIFDTITNTRYKKANTEEEYTPIDMEKELAWMQKALPQLSKEDHVRIVKGLIKIANGENPEYAYGKTQQGIMTISEVATSGTVYHEAFHAVIDVLLDEQEVDELFKKGSKRYGIERDSLDNEIAIEENLAEDFRRFVQREQAYQKDLEQSSGISKIFKTLKHAVKTWLNNTSYINNMFYRINKGKMANRKKHDASRNRVYAMWSREQKQAKKIYFDRVYNRSLSDWEIVDINTKLKQISDRIGDAPWHLQPAKNGGYYIAGYNNRSVTFDNYYSYYLDRYKKIEYTSEEKAILDKAPRNAEGKLLAPNGKPTNLTERQWLQVRTKAFKEWFGDWENVNNLLSNLNKIDSSLVDVEQHYKPWKNNKNKGNNTLRIYLKDHSKGYFELVKDEEFGMYSVHFKTAREGGKYNAEATISTKEDRKILFKELIKLIPNGAQISTWGEISEDGIKGINNLGRDLIKVGEREITIKSDGSKVSIPIYQKGEGVSKVIDENGEPLVVYHGGEANIKVFLNAKDNPNYNKTKHANYHNNNRVGIYFSKYRSVANNYARKYSKSKKEVYSVFLNIKNPYNVKYSTTFLNRMTKAATLGIVSKPDVANIKAEEVNTVYEGYDGINHQNGEELIIWDSNKVKSATDNIGTFSTTNNDIRYRESRITPEAIQQYHREQLDYSNLEDSQKSLLEDRGITEEQYEFLTQAERENLKQCLI